MVNDGPLAGLRVLELAGLAPAPFCGLLLASYGASVLRIDRPHPLAHAEPPPDRSNLVHPAVPLPPPTPDLLTTHKSSICLDLKSPSSRALLFSLLPHVDILIDPFRPGVLESSDLDPETVLRKANPGLIVARLTGFRREGKYATMAGHDINYLAVSGILGLLGPSGQQPPQPPGNILADFAGGGLVAFTGILLALLRRAGTGQGQVVEANMVDGVGFLGAFPRLATKTPLWSGPRGTNLLDGGAPFYRCYETGDVGRYVAVGALEPQFFAVLLDGLGLAEKEVLPPGFRGGRDDKEAWPYMTHVLEKRFKQKTRSEWEGIFDGRDACVTPVLDLAELEQQGYEHKPLVRLTRSPGQEVADQWVPRPLRPGEGGEQRLRHWLGWKRGREFAVEGGALVRLEGRSKL